jgi:hypothetical protein
MAGVSGWALSRLSGTVERERDEGAGMVTKDEKPTVVKAARGPILPGELTRLLQLAAADATWVYIIINWASGHKAIVKETSELTAIEDPTGISSVYASFSFEGKSDLKIDLDRNADFTFTAKGQIARQRLPVIAEYWANIPGRGRLSYDRMIILPNIPFGLLMAYGKTCDVSPLLTRTSRPASRGGRWRGREPGARNDTRPPAGCREPPRGLSAPHPAGTLGGPG